MVRRPPTRSSILIAISLLVAFVVWTWLTFNSPAFAAFDQRTLAPPLDPTSRAAEIGAAFAILTWPGFEYAALVAIALWASRRRLRQLAVALILVITLSWGGVAALKLSLICSLQPATPTRRATWRAPLRCRSLLVRPSP